MAWKCYVASILFNKDRQYVTRLHGKDTAPHAPTTHPSRAAESRFEQSGVTAFLRPKEMLSLLLALPFRYPRNRFLVSPESGRL